MVSSSVRKHQNINLAEDDFLKYTILRGICYIGHGRFKSQGNVAKYKRQVRLGVGVGVVRNHFLYVQFWIRLAAVSYRGEKFRTPASPAVRSVNKSRDTRNCVQNEWSLTSSPLVYITIVLTMATVTLEVTEDVSARHGRCHGDNPWKYRKWLFNGPNCVLLCKTYWKWKRMMAFISWCCFAKQPQIL